jgi:hypothetical protein
MLGPGSKSRSPQSGTCGGVNLLANAKSWTDWNYEVVLPALVEDLCGAQELVAINSLSFPVKGTKRRDSDGITSYQAAG